MLCAAIAVLHTPAKAQPPCPEAAAAQQEGFDAARLCAVLTDFAAEAANFHGLVIERHGTVVAQAYRQGKDRSVYSLFAHTTSFNAGERHDMRSISKSITSLLWGIAQAQGKTPPLDTPVLALYPDLTQLKGQGREKVTLRHLLTMSSGLAWNEPNAYNSANDELGLYWRSQARYLFDRPMAEPAGTRFNYNGGGTAILAQILASRTGMPLQDYARIHLFEPLGITDWEWMNDVRGRPLAFSGLRMRPADLARIGRMMLQRGQWQGRQIVPAAWLNDATNPHVATGDGLQYGYQWWLGSTAGAGHVYRWSAGFGNGGQRLYMVPELDLVVVITAGEYNQASIGPRSAHLLRQVVEAVK
jgi:CubicO group peptidase (beta-lactamase class C family)